MPQRAIGMRLSAVHAWRGNIHAGRGLVKDPLVPATRRAYAARTVNDSSAMNFINSFLLRWALTTLPLWVASYIFRGVSFDSVETLIIAGLLLGLVNAIIKPLIIVLTLPITLLTLGLFIIVINTAILFLVQWLVPGFRIADLGAGVLLALFISVFSFAVNRMVRP